MYTSNNEYQIVKVEYDEMSMIHTTTILCCKCGCVFENCFNLKEYSSSFNKRCPDCAERERIKYTKLGKEMQARMNSLMRETDTEEALLLSDPSREEWN